METEITVQVFGSSKKIREFLEKQNYQMIENYQMKDYYFSKYSLEEIKNMDYAELLKNSFLVREILDDKPHFQICYKDKRTNKKGDVISENKIVSNIANSKNALTIFKSANLTNWCVVDNNTYVYKKGEVEFALQIIKGLGSFLELEEDEKISKFSVEQKRKILKQRVQSVGLKLGEDYSCKKPYMLLHRK